MASIIKGQSGQPIQFETKPQVNGDDVLTRPDIVGTVSQSGGVPTGAIIQRGSNANGIFVRYADGTAILGFRVGENRTSSGVVTTTVTLPLALIDAEVGGGTTLNSTPYAITATLDTAVPATAVNISFNNPTTTTVEIRIDRTNSTNTGCIVIVYGRWY